MIILVIRGALAEFQTLRLTVQDGISLAAMVANGAECRRRTGSRSSLIPMDVEYQSLLSS